MCRCILFLTIIMALICSGPVFGASVILNEYNAVGAADFFNGGNSAADDSGGRAADTYFGRVQGNGGDWFELVVITDHLDMRNWKLDIYENGTLDKTLDLTNHSIWSDLRSGTIITVAEDVPSDISYDPANGDWWINVQANDNADGKYIEASNFVVSSNNWQLRIRNATGAVVFGPAGEGVSPQNGIGNTEVFRLEADPSASITANSTDYDDGSDFSTFGAPNHWGTQDFSQLRTVSAQAASLTILKPNGLEHIVAGTNYTVEWMNVGTVTNVLVEFSLDDGKTWHVTYPPNIGNTGRYEWLVPMIDSNQCLVRISSANRPAVSDTSDRVFSIYQCPALGDLTGDCIVDMVDLAVMASHWLECGNPQSPLCQ
jgi:hypothetical protein